MNRWNKPILHMLIQVQESLKVLSAIFYEIFIFHQMIVL